MKWFGIRAGAPAEGDLLAIVCPVCTNTCIVMEREEIKKIILLAHDSMCSLEKFDYLVTLSRSLQSEGAFPC